jgi:hypothetical protein
MLLQLAKKFHPDTNKDDSGAEKKFQEVNRAYEVGRISTQCIFRLVNHAAWYLKGCYCL